MTKTELRRWLLYNAFNKGGTYVLSAKIENSIDHLEALLDFTSFFIKPIPLIQRAYAFLNGQTYLNRCIVCQAELYPAPNRAQLYCGSRCLRLDPRIKEKAKNTCLQKYGDTSPSKTDAVKCKARNTCLRRYGVKSTLLLEEVQVTRNDNNMAKYGVEHTLQIPEVKEKAIASMQSKYGVDHPSQSPALLAKRDQANILKYGSSHAMKNPDIQKKAQLTCLDRYGVPNPIQMHVGQFNLTRLNNPEWLIDQYMTKGISTKSIAAELGVNICCVNKHLRACGVPVIQRSTSGEEESLSDWLARAYTGNIVLNNRSLIAPYELDIYLPDADMAVEYNGVYWHTEEKGRDKKYHLNKTDMCADKGIQLLHIFSTDDIEIWKSVIQAKLGNVRKIGARKTDCREVDRLEALDFLNSNHLQGAVNSPIRLGLYYGDELVSLMTFGRPRFNKHYEYELIRFCTKKGYQVIGGASRLLKNSGIKNCISYANRRWSDGRLYEAIGFEVVSTSAPNYFYTKDHLSLQSRNKFQKHKLINVLSDFDPTRTEYQNMQANGYSRIWDCGNLVYSFFA